MNYEIRKRVAYREEIYHDGGPRNETPLIKAIAAVVIKNPFAGRHVADLGELIAPSAALGTMLARTARALLEGRPAESYGKGGIAGSAGEQEHVVACITTPFGDALREGVGGGNAWVSSVTKSGGPGTPLDIPLAHKDALYVRSHYDAVTLAIPDAPHPDELVIALALSTGSRVHQRAGGLRKEDALMDGLR
ncbi:MAG: amino acid synthesis family protein [Vulcanimicrobiaceae bacterium]